MHDMAQLTIWDSEELTLKQMLEKIISDVCQKQKVDSKYVHCNDISGGYSVWICEPIDVKETLRVFNIISKNTKKTKRTDVSIKYKRIDDVEIPADAELIIKDEKHRDDNNDVYYIKKATVRFPLSSNTLYDYLYKVFDYQLKQFEPSEKFGCCGKYLECSNAKECLYDEKFYARSCSYKSNLEAGRIFYGVNANT